MKGGEKLSDLKVFNSEASLSDFSVINSRFTRARCKILYPGRNRNYTDITENAINDLINRKGYANVPVVAHLYKGDDGKWRVGGHDSKFVASSDGHIEIVDETIPFGTIPENCNPSFEDVTEKSGVVKRYFCTDIILWTHRYNIMDAVKSDEIWFNQSMEIEINSCHYDNADYCVIDDFDLSALCLLNHDPYDKENEVEPCFPSAAVTKFNFDKMKNEFSVMYAELSKLNDNKEVRKVDFEKIKSALDEKYIAVQATPDNVIAINKESFEVYSIPFTVDTENGVVAFDYAKAVNKYVSVSDKDTGFSMFAVKQYVADYGNSVVLNMEKQYAEKIEAAKAEAIVEITDKYNALSDKFNEVSERCEAAEKKIHEYAAAEEQAEKDAHKAKIDGVVKSYAEQLETNAEYVLYKQNVDYSKTVEQVDRDMLIILGKCAKNGTAMRKFSANWGISDALAGKKTDRYGGLLDEFNDD